MAALLLVLYLPACYHYVPLRGMTPQGYISAKHPKRIRLTLADSTYTELLEPWASADSLGGSLFLSAAEPGVSRTAGEPVSVPLSSVRRMEIFELDVSNTITAVGVPLAAMGLVFGFMWMCTGPDAGC